MKDMYCDFIAGCFGGALGVIVGHPLDTVKTWQQASNSSVTRAMDKIYNRNQGFNGFYRGMLFPLVTTGAINSLLFGIYGNHLRQLQRTCHSDYQREEYEDQHIFIAGSLAGFFQSFIACPMELIKIRLQTHWYYNDYLIGQKKTPWILFKKILKRDGISGLYRGLLPMMCRDVLPYGIYMLTYQKTMQALNNSDHIRKIRQQEKNSRVDFIVTTLGGAFAGVISWACVIPFDVVKTLMQAEDNAKYHSIRQCLRINLERHGWRSLFRGSWILLLRAVPVNVVTFLGYEHCLEWCHKYYGIADNTKKFL